MKIILDTNVLIDAMSDDFSYTWKIIELILKGELSAFASDKILKEYHLIIERNVVREKDKQRLENFLAQIEIVEVYQNKKYGNLIPDDPEDEKFLLAGEVAQVDFIISSDAHLLRLEKYKKIKILTPKDFWFFYQGNNGKADEWKDIFKGIMKI